MNRPEIGKESIPEVVLDGGTKLLVELGNSEQLA